MAFEYPPTRRVDQVDDYHGTAVADPYRWLEQSADVPEVRAWIEAQNAVTFSHLETMPEREAFRARLTELWDYPKLGTPFKRGGRYFQFRNSGLQNQNVLHVMDDPRDEGRVLLDPNMLSDDGTVALGMFSVSKSGRYLAYSISASGSDWQTWHVRDVATGEDLDDVIEWSKFSTASWRPDDSGFFYSAYPEPEEGAAYTAKNENGEVRYHAIGTPAAEDEVVYARPDEPEWGFNVTVTEDGDYLILYIRKGASSDNLVFWRPLDGEGAFHPLIGEWCAKSYMVGNDGETFYLFTDHGAGRGRLVAVDAAAPDRASWRDVVPESDDILQGAVLVGDQAFCFYMRDASHRIERFSLSGDRLGEIALPAFGSIMALNARRDDHELFYGFTSFLHPGSSFRYDVRIGESEELPAPQIDFPTGRYLSRQVFVTSKDGTRVPMFLVHRRDVEPNGANPTLLYGYGGFNVPLTPDFSISRLAWLERGGVVAIANLRGGGEYGKVWHEAGTLGAKQNVFDDFIACAEHLIAENITSPDRLAIQGGSNGGLLVGAVMIQRPDLFAAVLPAVGVMDMLRFHKFTIGWAWVSDYGSADDPDQFEALYAYSPLHNLQEGTAYPATLVTTSDHDDRVVPAHSFKFAAALQHAHEGDAPVLIRIQTKAGHGAGKPTAMVIEEQADIWAFLVGALGMDKPG